MIRIYILIISLFCSLSLLGQTKPTDIRLSYFSANKTLDKVLDELTIKSEKNIIYSKSKLPRKSNVTVSFTNETLETILQVILDDYKMSYSIIGDQIVIVRNRSVEHKSFQLYGVVKDLESGEALPYASVYLSDGLKGVHANENGFFSLKTNVGDNTIVTSYVGYATDTMSRVMKSDSLVNIYLKSNVKLNEISLSDSLVSTYEDRTSFSKSDVDGEFLLHNLHLGGEADVIRVVSNEAGVSSSADGFGGISVRGGNIDQNLVLLDGVPIYNTGHALGIISVFNSSVIKDATLIKGGFPARYGGRLSSVLDVKTREGNYYNFGGEANLSILSSKFVLEGPIQEGKSSFLLTARRTYADPWLKGITKYQIESNGGTGESNYYFYDLNAKVNFQLNKNHRLFVNAYKGGDDFEHNSRYEEDLDNDISKLDWNWGNRLLSLHLNSRWGKSVFSRLLVYSSEFDLNSFEVERYQSEQDSIVKDNYRGDIYNSRIKSLGVKLDFDFLTGKNHFWKWGLSYEKKNFLPFNGVINNNNTEVDYTAPITKDLIETKASNVEISDIRFFVEDEINTESMVLNVGMHTSVVKAGSESYFNVEPRASLLVPGSLISFRAGVAKMIQNMHLLSSYSLGLPKDIWVPTTENLSPASSWNFNIGLILKTGNNLEFGVEGFYKTLSDIKNLPEGAAPNVGNDEDWDQILLNGEGTAHGVEFYFNKEVGQSKWRINYTLQKSNREFDGLNQDREFIFGVNRNHNFKLNFRRTLTENSEFNMIYNYASGNYITVPEGDVIWRNNGTTNQIIEIYSGINTEQLPHYHRLDLGFNFFSKLKIGRQRLFLGVYNVMNRKNPLFIDLERDFNNPGKFEKIQYSILPIFPTFNYSLSF